MTDAVIAIDLGTSAIKAMLVDRNGTIIALDRIAHVTHRPVAGAAEQDPEEWWANACSAVRRLIRQQPELNVAAIAVTGQMHGLVMRDWHGRLATHAMTWQDRRSASTLPALVDTLSRHVRHPGRLLIEPGYQIASWHWLESRDPYLIAGIRHIASPLSEMIFRLTGRHVTEPSDAVGTGWFDTLSGYWDLAATAATGTRDDLLPEIVPSGSVTGTVTASIAGDLAVPAGIPVVIAGGDAAVAAFGAGVVEPDNTLLMLSSGCQILEPSAGLPATITHDALYWPSANPAGLPPWLRVGTTTDGGNAIDWASRAFGSVQALSDHDTGSDTRAPVFLPYLHGARAPVSLHEASGAFIGLAPEHDAGDLAQAVIDGVTLGIVDLYHRMFGGLDPELPLWVGGGGARNRTWLSAITLAFARPLNILTESDLSAWGAARTAATTLGWIDPAADPEVWTPCVEHVTPADADPDRAMERLTSYRRLALLAGELASEWRG